MKKILFLESKQYYDNLGVLSKKLYNTYEVEFDGSRFYKKNAEFFSDIYAVVSTIYTSPINNYVIFRAKLLNIRTILLADGISDYSNSYSNPFLSKYKLKLYDPVLHDIFLCVGKHMTEYYSYGCQAMHYLPKRIDTIVDTLPCPGNGRVLITTANSPYFNKDEFKALVTLLKKTITGIEQNGIEFDLRIFDEAILTNLNGSFINRIEGSFEDVLADYDIVITTPSSISIAAMTHNRCVAQLVYRDTPYFINTGWTISGVFPIEITIHDMLARNVDRLLFQQKTLLNYIEENKVPADHVFLQALKESIVHTNNERVYTFINQNMYNLITSKMNINLECFLRRLYLKCKGNNFVKKMRVKLR